MNQLVVGQNFPSKTRRSGCESTPFHPTAFLLLSAEDLRRGSTADAHQQETQYFDVSVKTSFGVGSFFWITVGGAGIWRVRRRLSSD